MTISIEQYKNKAKQAEKARVELENNIEEKTGHPCAVYVSNGRHKKRLEFKLQCITVEGFIAVSKLFIDKPFYQEEFIQDFEKFGDRYTVSAKTNKHGESLEVLSIFTKREYNEWLGAMRNE